jgi:hypothetical protein
MADGMKPSSDKPTYRLEIRALPANAEPLAALKRLLKATLRAYQFRVVSVVEVKPDAEKKTPAKV